MFSTLPTQTKIKNERGQPHSQASPECEHVYAGRAWYLFSCEHDIVKIGPEFLEQKGNVLCVVQPNIRSTLGIYDIQLQCSHSGAGEPGNEATEMVLYE